ncbi:MAG: Lrp/AsnC family transcriptional regulator [Candidatus Baldrarchaeia archaeon]
MSRQIDGIDRKIIMELQRDGRMSLVDLAKKVGLTHPTVRERLLKLLRDNYMKIQANINYRMLGLLMALVCVELENANDAIEMMNCLEKCPRVPIVAVGSGAYNVFAIVVAEDANTLNAVVEMCIRSKRGVKRMSLSYVCMFKPEYLPFKVVDEKRECKSMCENCEFLKNEICRGCNSPLMK